MIDGLRLVQLCNKEVQNTRECLSRMEEGLGKIAQKHLPAGTIVQFIDYAGSQTTTLGVVHHSTYYEGDFDYNENEDEGRRFRIRYWGTELAHVPLNKIKGVVSPDSEGILSNAIVQKWIKECVGEEEETTPLETPIHDSKTTDAVRILHKRFIGNDPEQIELLRVEREMLETRTYDRFIRDDPEKLELLRVERELGIEAVDDE